MFDSLPKALAIEEYLVDSHISGDGAALDEDPITL